MKDEPLVRWLLDKGTDPNFGCPQTQKLNAMEADNESGFALNEAAKTWTTAVFDLLIKGVLRGNTVSRSMQQPKPSRNTETALL